jgi:hypothetical protein
VERREAPAFPDWDARHDNDTRQRFSALHPLVLRGERQARNDCGREATTHPASQRIRATPHARLPAKIIPRVLENLSRHLSVTARAIGAATQHSKSFRTKYCVEIFCGLRCGARRTRSWRAGAHPEKRGLIPFRHVFGARHDRRHEQQQQNSADDVERQHEAISLIVP